MIARLWSKDTTLFAPPDAAASVHAAIRNRLGWLDAPTTMTARLAEVREVLDGARRDGLTHLLVLGMGGSSLCAEVLRDAADPSAAAHLVMLDSTDEKAVLDTAAALDPARTLVVVASKSGGTIEVTSLERYFRVWVERASGAAAGRQFVERFLDHRVGNARSRRQQRRILTHRAPVWCALRPPPMLHAPGGRHVPTPVIRHRRRGAASHRVRASSRSRTSDDRRRLHLRRPPRLGRTPRRGRSATVVG